LHLTNWTYYFSTSYPSINSLDRRISEDLCPLATVYVNNTQTIRVRTSRSVFTDIQYGAVDLGVYLNGFAQFDGVGGKLYAVNQGYTYSITFRDTLNVLQPILVLSDAEIDCVIESITVTYINHGEGGISVISLTVGDKQIVREYSVISGSGNFVIHEADVDKICSGQSCLTVKSCISREPVIQYVSRDILDHKDSHYGFVIATIVLGSFVVLAAVVQIFWAIYKRKRIGRYRPVSSEEMETVGEQQGSLVSRLGRGKSGVVPKRN